MPRLILLTMLLLLTSCGSAQSIPLANSANAPLSRVYLRSIRVDAEINQTIEGIAIFIEGRSPHEGITARYPQEGAAFTLKPGDEHTFGYTVGIPNQEDASVSMVVVAVPRNIPPDVLDGIAFGLTKLVTLAKPELGIVMEIAEPYVTDLGKEYLKRGRVLGALHISGAELARQPVYKTDSFTIAVAVERSGGTVPSAQKLVDAESLNLRDGPGKDAALLISLPRGTSVTLLGEVVTSDDLGIWVRVRANGVEGWVNRRFLRDADAGSAGPERPPSSSPAASSSAYRVKPDIDFAAVRSQPSTQSVLKQKLDPGSTVACEQQVRGEAVVGNDTRWINCAEAGGYIYYQLLDPLP